MKILDKLDALSRSRAFRAASLAALLLASAAIVGPHVARAVDISRSDVWSETAANNTSSTEPGYPEGMAPSRVNDASRELMAALKRFWNHINPTVAATGSSGTYNFTWAVQPSTVVNGQLFGMWANHTNSGAATANIHGLVTRAIVKASTNGLVALGASDITANTFHLFAATGGQLQLLNPNIIVERGEWTPVLVGTTTRGTQTYTGQRGFYTRIADMVTVWGKVVISATDATMAGNVIIGDLPYAAAPSATPQVHFPCALGRASNITIAESSGYFGIHAAISQGATGALLLQVGNNVGDAAFGPNNIGATGVEITCTYKANL